MQRTHPGLYEDFVDFIHDPNKSPMLLHGPTGSGKTRSALCLMDQVDCDDFFGTWQGLYAAWYASETEKIRWMGREFFRGSMLPFLAKQDLIVVDDIGIRENVTESQCEKLQAILDLNLYRKRPNRVILTSNHSSSDLEKIYGRRVSDRIMAGTVRELFSPDGVSLRLQHLRKNMEVANA
jgi:DNA replication protein DnaC